MSEATVASTRGNISKSALIIIDMQNDFVSDDGYFGRVAKMYPQLDLDREFILSTVPKVKRLAEEFRAFGRPVVHVPSVVEADYRDARWPYWLLPSNPAPIESQFLVRGTWGAEILDELKPMGDDLVVIKKVYNGFHNTALEFGLRERGVTTCVMTGVTSCVCVGTTARGAVERDFRLLFVSDATAEVHRDWHKAELAVMEWVYGDVVTVDQVVELLNSALVGATA
jgi:nicotinamidase-related amidase